MKTQNESIPTREQLAMIAAATLRPNPTEAVQHALALWRESGNALEAFKWREFGSIPMPENFPATLEDFHRLIVKGKTPADREKSFRDFLKWQTANAIERGSLKSPHENEVENFAVNNLKAWRNGGCPGKQQWLVTARDYLQWHAQNISKTNRENALKRTQKPTSLPVTKKGR